MKHAKKLASLLLALAMVLGLATTAFAANTTPHTITIENDADGHTYLAYQVFKGDLSADGTILTNIEWGDGVNDDALLEALKKEEAYADCKTANDVAMVLADFKANDNAEAIQEFAKLVNQHLTDNVAGTSQYDGDNYTIDVEGDGYYFVKDEFAVEPDGATNFILQVVKDVTVQPKNPQGPDIDKKIVEDNEEKVATGAQVGDTVNFKITTQIPTPLSSYDTYTFKIIDELSVGLTPISNSVTVSVNEEDITGNYGDYSCEVTGQTITVTFDSDYALAHAGAMVVLTYSATVNEEALVHDKETNTAKVVYSNNPSDKESYTEKPSNPVYVYDFDIVIDKYDGKNADTKLADAEFVLYKKDASENVLYYQQDTVTKAVTWVNNIDEATRITTDEHGFASFQGLEDGRYYLKETVAPDGYNLLQEDQEVTITVEYDYDGTVIDTTAKSEGGGQYEQLIKVPNNVGTLLPSTGGIGTTIFYALGAVLVVGAGVVLVSKKRMG